jgi:hypothetical protein
VIKVRLLAHMAKNLFDDQAYYRVILEDDNVFEKALNVATNFNSYQVINGTLTAESAAE